VVLHVSRAILASAAIAGSLAGCGSRVPPEEAGSPVAATALPHPKAGLWQWNSRAGGRKQLCLSGQVLSPLAPRPGCPTSRQVRTISGAYVVETRCQSGPVSRTWAKAAGDYNRAFSLDIAVSDSRGDISDHADYRYQGPCAPGQHPDDLP
jgi:hypothetical protein